MSCVTIGEYRASMGLKPRLRWADLMEAEEWGVFGEDWWWVGRGPAKLRNTTEYHRHKIRKWCALAAADRSLRKSDNTFLDDVMRVSSFEAYHM